MPIYEYRADDPAVSCDRCRRSFETLQAVSDKPLTVCPDCGAPVTKIVSWCRAAVVEESDEHSRTMRKVKDYESEGMWSHAAELADTHAEKTKDDSLRSRAYDNYKKAGYKPDGPPFGSE